MTRKSQSRLKPVEYLDVRLILEAICPVCGPLWNEPNDLMDGLFAVFVAEAHTAETGHVVALNGTTDAPEAAAEEKSHKKVVAITVSQKWGEA